MIDALLISPPSRMDNHYRPPLDLMYVASYYREKGLTVKIADFPFTEHIRNSKFWEKRNELVKERKILILDEVIRCSPELIGVSCYSTEYDEVKELISEIKKISKAKIMVGGVHPTLKPEDFDVEVVQGRRDAGYCCYDLIDMKHYSTPNPYGIRGVLLSCGYVVSGFGCPSQCTFCVASTLRKHIKVSSKEPEDLLNEVLTLKYNYKMDAFYIIDDLYTLNKQKVKDFCWLVAPHKMLWGCNSRVNTLDEITIKNMADAGCIQLDFGVERGSNEALRKLKKGITIEQIKETFRLCRKYKIRTFANFLTNIPDETMQDLKDIENLIKEIKPTITCINVYEQYLGCQLPFNKPSEELMKWKSRVMVRYNWNSWIKGLRYLNLKYYKAFPMLIKEGVNQLCGR